MGGLENGDTIITATLMNSVTRNDCGVRAAVTLIGRRDATRRRKIRENLVATRESRTIKRRLDTRWSIA